MIKVATWNVLHRVHAGNWVEDALTRWPDETERIAAVTARLAARTERVIALQEVSGDQLASLHRALPGRTGHVLRYPRVPKPRHGACPLHDPGEHLVLIVEGPSETVAAESFPDAPGKGALVVETPEAILIAVHLAADQRRTGQLARLAELAAVWRGHPVVLLGDFNADRAAVTSALGAGFAVAALPPGSPPTRPGSTPPDIDHVIVRDAAVRDATVECVDGLSDHRLLRATVDVRR